MFNNALLKQLAAELVRRNETVAVAESVTAGLLQAALASAEDATAFFQGGMTVYNITQKLRHLHIDPTNAIRCNCVSEDIAAQMATGILHNFGSHWGIGITGYAVPIPGHDMHQLYACYAIAAKSGVVGQHTVYKEAAQPLDVQLFYVDNILQSFEKILRR